MDKEKIIRGLERCLVCNTSAITSAEGEKAYRDCEYTVGLYCRQDKLLRDVLALLKEQEAKPVRIDEDSVHCPSCGNELFTYPRQKFCDECGQAVKWE